MKKFYLYILISFLYINSFSQELSLIYPKNNSVFSDTNIIFQWNNLLQNTEIIISQDTLFNTIIIDSIITGNSITLNFNYNNVYYWKIKNTSNETNYNTFNIISPVTSGLNISWYSSEDNTHNFDTVTQLTDKVGNYNLIQDIDNRKPYISYNSTIGYNGIIFNDANNFLKNETEITPTGYILVVKIDDLPSFSTIYTMGGDNGLSIHNNKFQARFNQDPNKRKYITNTDTSYYIIGVKSSYFQNEATSFYLNNITNIGIERTLDNGIYNLGSRNGIYGFIGIFFEQFVFYDNYNDSLYSLYYSYLHYKYAPPVNLGYNIHIPYDFCDTTLDAGARFTNYIWNTGDTTQTITINQPGQYFVTVTDIFGFQSSDSIMVYYPQMNQPINDTLICYGDTIKWNAGLQDTNYTFLWQDNTTDSIMTIFSTGEYFVQITDSLGCSYKSDTIHITINNYPITTSLGTDTSLCVGQNLFLQTGVSETVNYFWNTGDTTEYLQINSAGEYSLTTTNTIGCTATDTINVAIHGYAPIPGFDFTNTCFNDTTSFIDTSYTSDGSNIIYWQWYFGNTETSNIQNPNILFLDTGLYEVSLIVGTDSNCTNQISKQIRIYPLPIADFENTQLCQHTDIQFINNTTLAYGNLNQFIWDFGTDDFSNDTNPVYNYNDFGYYNISLIAVSDNNCTDTTVKNVEIKPSPVSDFVTSETCKDKVISFYNNSFSLPYNPIYETLWDFGDGTTSDGENPNYLFYGNDSIYSVSLKIKSINGCTDSISKQIILYNNPKAHFETTQICANTNTVIINNSIINNDTIVNNVWIINDKYYYEYSPEITINSSGQIAATLTVTTQHNCTDKFSQSINVLEQPSPEFEINPKWGIVNEPAQLTPLSEGNNFWNFGNGNTSYDSIAYTNYTDSGIFLIEHIIVDTNNCADTLQKNYRIVIPYNDIAINNLRYSVNNNILNVEVDIINIGNLPVNKLKFTLTPESYSSINEIWEGEFIYGNSMTYTVKSEYILQKNRIPKYVCVNVLIEDKYKDVNLENNYLCSNKTNITIYPVYPNPAKDIINLNFYLNNDTKTTIELFDSNGKIIYKIQEQQYTKGFHKLNFNINALSKGIYTIRIKINNKQESIKFIKQ